MRVLIAGATSAIAEAVARLLAARGDQLFLIGRREQQLAAIADDLRLRGAAAVWHTAADLDRTELHRDLIAAAREKLCGLDVVLIAYGVLPDQKLCSGSVERTLNQFHTNAVSQIALSLESAQDMLRAGDGTVAVISSVAGDRARKSNYAYGAAKAGLNTFLSGLRMQLRGSGVHVLTIKPGLVDTPMTAHLAKGVLWASPQSVARDIVAAIDARRAVLYTPGRWQLIILILRHLPERLLARLNF